MKMNFLIPLTAVIAVFSSCSVAYRAGQTTDDIYYSSVPVFPAPPEDVDYYDAYTASTDDNYLRMKVTDHYRWDSLDDYEYWNDSRYYASNYNGTQLDDSYYNGYDMYDPAYIYDPYYSPYGQEWLGYGCYYNNWYNPWQTVIWYRNPKAYNVISKNTTLTAFGNHTYNNTNTAINNGNGNGGRNTSQGGRYNNNNSNNNQAPANNSTQLFNSGTAPSNDAGGRSGGYNSTGTGSAGSRPGRG